MAESTETSNFNGYIGTLVQLIVSILIIIVNTPVLYISISKRNKIGADAILISIIAINDFLIGACMLGYTIYKLIGYIHITRDNLYCQISGMVHLAFSTGMCLSVTFLAIYRYLTYVKSWKLNIKLCIIMLSSLSFFGYLISVLCAVFQSYSLMPSKVYCFIYFDTGNKFGLVILWVGLILSLIGYPIIMLCYVLISIHQYRIIKQIQIENSIYSQSNEELKKFLKHQRIKGSFQVLFTMALFLLQTGPQLVSYLLAGIFKVKRGPYEDFIIDTMFRLTAVTNPLLILLFHNDFCSILKNIVANRFSTIFCTTNKN